MSFDEFVKAHNLDALNDIQKTCKVLNVGHSRFYADLVKNEKITLVENGSRRNVSAEQIYSYYRQVVTKPATKRKVAA